MLADLALFGATVRRLLRTFIVSRSPSERLPKVSSPVLLRSQGLGTAGDGCLRTSNVVGNKPRGEKFGGKNSAEIGSPKPARAAERPSKGHHTPSARP
jgi:hypothetical protein